MTTKQGFHLLFLALQAVVLWCFLFSFGRTIAAWDLSLDQLNLGGAIPAFAEMVQSISRFAQTCGQYWPLACLMVSAAHFSFGFRLLFSDTDLQVGMWRAFVYEAVSGLVLALSILAVMRSTLLQVFYATQVMTSQDPRPPHLLDSVTFWTTTTGLILGVNVWWCLRTYRTYRNDHRPSLSHPTSITPPPPSAPQTPR